jgi:predicted Zn-dependent protease
MRHRRLLAASLGLLSSAVVACTTAMLATSSGEAKLGAEAAAEVEKEVGFIEAPELQHYVGAIGQRLVERGSRLRRDVTYQIDVVDMAVPNAFALPGGYVYVSRGLLALLNSEDELASVIAHEIGHVSARHHLNHALREAPFLPVRLATGIGSIATGIISPGLGHLVGALGSAPGSIYLASYSRGQEEEADAIGQQIVADAGWDPRAMAQVMDALSRDAELAGRDPEEHGFLDTHPTTPARSRQTIERASTLKAAALPPIASDTRQFYARLDGLLYGDPASAGAIVDNEFLHPELDLRVAFPKDWQVANGADAVVAVPGQRDALAALSIAAKGDDAKAAAKRVVAEASLSLVGGVTAVKIGGLPAFRASATSRKGREQIHHAIAWIAYSGVVYQVSGTALEKDWPRYGPALTRVVESFRPLTTADCERVREARIRVVTAHAGERLSELLARSDSAWPADRAAAANGLPSSEDALADGRPVKVARWEHPAGLDCKR